MDALKTDALKNGDDPLSLDADQMRRVFGDDRYSVCDLDTLIRVLTEIRKEKLAAGL
jgi:hypothetical protein